MPSKIAALAGVVLIAASAAVTLSMPGAAQALAGGSAAESLVLSAVGFGKTQQIEPGNTVEFVHETDATDVMLMWGVEIKEHARDDSVIVHVPSQGFMDRSSEVDGPMGWGTILMDEGLQIFEVENTGSRPVRVAMAFVDDPSGSSILNDPDSGVFATVVVPLLVAAALLIAGVAVVSLWAVTHVVPW